MVDTKVLDQIKPGMKIRIFERIKEKNKERLSRFEGMVIARKHGKEAGATITVRSTVAGVGMEKVIPLYSPLIGKVEIMQTPKRKVRQSKLYYLRKLSQKAIRRKIGV